MNVVLDTNILISARIFGGKPRTIFDLAVQRKKIIAVTSLWLIDEYLGVLQRKFDHDEQTLARVRKLIMGRFTVVSPSVIPSVITDDPSDNQILAVTHEHAIDYIISGDNHLLQLKAYNHIPILTPDQFLSSQ